MEKLMLNLGRYKEENGNRLSDFLPWALLVAPGVVEQKDGLLQKTIIFRGQDLDSSTRAELISANALINNALKRLESGFSIFVEARRQYATTYPGSKWPNKISRLIDDERKTMFETKGSHFESFFYMTFVYARPSERKSGFLNLFSQKTEEANRDVILNHFLSETDKVVSLLRQCMPLVHELNDDETLTYLHSTISTNQHYVKAPETPMYLDSILPDQDVEHGLETKLGDSFLRTITIRGFPGSTYPAILDSLNDLELEYRWVSRYIAFGKEEGLREIDLYRKRWYGKRKSLGSMAIETIGEGQTLDDTNAYRKSSDADEAMQELEDDFVSFGHFTATVTVWDKNGDEADKKAKLIQRAINSKGFVTKLETLQSSDAWLGSLPGHVYANVWRPIVNSLNLVHMLPLSAIWSGEEKNNHLDGPPHMITKTGGNTPFRFSTNVGDVGHTLILGPTGNGKSTLLALMAVQWLKYTDARVYAFDKGRSLRAATLAVGGDFFELGVADTGLSFQPLKDIDNENERMWASEWVADIFEQQKIILTAAEKNELWLSLCNLAMRPKQDRTITVLSSLLQKQSLRDALRPFTINGPYGQILDSVEETLTPSFWQTFEMAALMEQKGALAPTLAYLFHRLEQRFDGKPTLLIVDEGWRFLGNTTFSAKIIEWFKTLRKNRVYVIFSTQGVSDVINSDMRAILSEDGCRTKIFLPNSRAKDPEVKKLYAQIGLNERQIEILSSSIPKCHYYQQSAMGTRLFELGLGPIALAVCASSSPEDHKIMDEVLEKNTKENFLDAFLQRKGIAEVNNV